MKLTIIGGELHPGMSEFQQLQQYCQEQEQAITLEWREGQYWLHSDEAREKPIGLHLDRELTRHEEYFKHHSITKELLAKAIGVKSGIRPKVLDLTGGLLGDSLLFLSFGCEVITLERHPVIQVLIQSALQVATHPALKRLTFIPQEASLFLASAPEVDVIYFDPMFEDANERALPKKEMRIFRHFVGSDQDAQSVFEKAKSLRPKRLVVKRPRLSRILSGKPDIQYEGKATRYDVYLPGTK